MNTFTIEQSALVSALALVCGAIERRSTVPILAAIRIDAKAGTATFAGTDLDIEVSVSAPATIDGEFTAVVQAHTLQGIAATLTECAEFSLTKDDLLIRSGAFEFTLAPFHVHDWPEFTDPKNGVRFAMPAPVMRDAIGTVRHAISTEETRYYLNGIYLHNKGDALRLVATDGHRLATRDVPMPAGAKTMPSVIVPRGAIRILSTAIQDLSGDVEIELTDLKIAFRWEGGELKGKLIDGTYPDYERVIPSDGPTTATFDSAILKSAVARVISATHRSDRPVTVDLTEGVATLSVSDPDSASASERVPVTLTGPALKSRFNGNFLSQLLQFDGPVTLRLSDSVSPTVITFAGRDSRFVLMPMRL